MGGLEPTSGVSHRGQAKHVMRWCALLRSYSSLLSDSPTPTTATLSGTAAPSEMLLRNTS